MPESRLIYDQFKADILQWKNSHRGRIQPLRASDDKRGRRGIISLSAVPFQTAAQRSRRNGNCAGGDDSVENFDNISLLFSEESVLNRLLKHSKSRGKRIIHQTELHRPFGTKSNPFRSKSKRHGIILSAPLVLSWLYYGKSFEAMVSMVNKQSANPKADRMDRQSCSWVVERIIQVSIKNGFRTQADWDKYFSMNRAIENGTIGEWALQIRNK